MQQEMYENKTAKRKSRALPLIKCWDIYIWKKTKTYKLHDLHSFFSFTSYLGFLNFNSKHPVLDPNISELDFPHLPPHSASLCECWKADAKLSWTNTMWQWWITEGENWAPSNAPSLVWVRWGWLCFLPYLSAALHQMIDGILFKRVSWASAAFQGGQEKGGTDMILPRLSICRCIHKISPTN